MFWLWCLHPSLLAFPAPSEFFFWVPSCLCLLGRKGDPRLVVQARGDGLCRMSRPLPCSRCMLSVSGQLNTLPGPPCLPVWAWCFVCFRVSVCFRSLPPRIAWLLLWCSLPRVPKGKPMQGKSPMNWWYCGDQGAAGELPTAVHPAPSPPVCPICWGCLGATSVCKHPAKACGSRGHMSEPLWAK